ncbi:2-oxoacid:ferredoxin oxidoreductase subunit beta [Terricaulis sp.]|uniref:2-oxoacid:ferredoxin oxidoreductase subunit beta n=1 Tax=Terricaulis sp. TaxID=2768686 RepID=UPI002AC58A0B|nr:2-oxoacid:ferredoxin oxidoreductase subunit beta [Terricaulis sp.]MDZ4692617.1 2-oxoacid:ferredoxin oxidoreductase subunit beta [Terricaulis sp.]
MTYIAKPSLHHPSLEKNALGFTRRDYEGRISTLCAGCGHDSISASIIQACFEIDLAPHRLAKFSGIGCSSKTPDYFVSPAHGFNAVHGRMPSVLTGANIAARDLIYLGVSGDGDTASIGLGQFAHAVRRGVNMTYIVENNGVYGLTKGQFSATSDRGSKAKKGAENKDNPIDLVMLALQLGATYVGRSFSGDKTQLVPLIKGALSHKGTAILDVLSPCVAFNNHVGSTKSFDYVREHNDAVNRMDVISPRAPIRADYAPGELKEVTQHDGSILRLRKIADDYDSTDRNAALAYLARKAADGEIVTGLLFVDPNAHDLHDGMNTVSVPLNKLTDADLIPSVADLDKINDSLR